MVRWKRLKRWPGHTAFACTQIGRYGKWRLFCIDTLVLLESASIHFWDLKSKTTWQVVGAWVFYRGRIKLRVVDAEDLGMIHLFKLMLYKLANASASSNAPCTGATWTDQGWNAVEHIYHLRLVSERLSEAGMKIKPDDGKQNSITYSSESEDSEHSLAGGVIQYIYYIFSILVSSLHAVEAYIRHIHAEFYSILFYYFIFFTVICDCYLELCIHL